MVSIKYVDIVAVEVEPGVVKDKTVPRAMPAPGLRLVLRAFGK